MKRLTKQEILDLDKNVKNLLNFKRKVIDGNNGYYWEKRYICRFFTIRIEYYSDNQFIGIDILKGLNSLNILSKRCNFDELKEYNAYWKKESKEESFRKRDGIRKQLNDKYKT